MALALHFWSRLAMWSGILLVVLVTLSLAMGQALAEVVAHLPVWTGLAVALAAFPAGVAVAFQVFPDGGFSWRRTLQLFGAAGLASVAMFALGNQLGPRLAQATAAGGALNEAAYMTLGDLRSAMEDAVAEAESSSGPEVVGAWQAANGLVWQYVRRTDGVALPFLFALIGTLTGFWACRLVSPQLVQLQLWAMGLFLLMSTYLAGENSYELIVMRSAGPVYFAGDFVLIVPMILLIGLGWPTLIVAWKAKR